MTTEDLVKLKISFTGFLVLKGNADERVKTTTSLGKDCLWSSENLYRHLLLLEGLVPRTVCLSPIAHPLRCSYTLRD